MIFKGTLPAKDAQDGKQTQVSKEPKLSDEIGGLFSLTWTERVYGFAICFLLGVALAFLSLVHLGNVKMFAILYSVGNLLALFSTAFLIGPLNQIRAMFAPVRLTATGVYLAALGLTIYVAYKKNVVLCIVMITIQMGALLWYSLSYIPYARGRCQKDGKLLP